MTTLSINSQPGDGMIVRGMALAVLTICCLSLALGCSTKKASPPDEQPYPVRADWLVINVPSGVQPSKWYDPGFPPLLMLNRPVDTLTGDDAKLATRVGKEILDTRKKLEIELRGEFAKVLTELFGTPAAPRMPSGELLIGNLKLEEKLAAARTAYDAKQTEMAAARANLKMPDQPQLIDQLEGQANSSAAEVRTLQSQIGDLRSYISEFKLDEQTLKEGGVLYRNYCQQCHGQTGDGNGPGGRYLIPLPRDYRQGLFKFITTDPSIGDKRKPRREDLYRTITKGMDGSPMPQFGALKEAELHAIISYVIHLSVRGETEYEVMKDAVRGNVDEEDVRSNLLKEAAKTVLFWTASARNPLLPARDPYQTDEQILESAANGHALFTDSKVGCTTCHVSYGRKDEYRFDSWGSIVRPRNLTVPILRGGRSGDEIYSRIYGGILGSNMPAHTHLKPTLDEQVKGTNKIWDLVHFIQFISDGEKRQLLKEKKQIEID